MPIDMRQFHDTFFEESLEGLAHMETELMRLENVFAANPDDDSVASNPEIMNTIFRAAHSIKGGSSTFGFGDVAEFSHVLESRLDALREGRCRPDRHVVNLILKAVDCLRGLIVAARHGKPADMNAVQLVRSQLEALHEDELASPKTRESSALSEGIQTTHSRWRIHFRPQPQFFHTGNDPLRILRELDGLGRLTVQADLSSLPAWEEVDAEACYLAWTMELSGDVTRDTIMETFDWVIEDCKLDIELLPAVSDKPESPATPDAIHATDNHSGSIRVSTPKVDALINTVGELVITQSMLSQLTDNFTLECLPKLFIGISQLERNTRELQDSVMRIRMLPLSFTFNRFPRLVRDISHKLGKNVDLRISGEQTELDKTIIERISDVLMHLVRNCLDHGIESPAERAAAGKPERGIIELKAYQKSGNVVIEISDDGRGIQHERVFAKAIERGLMVADAKYTSKDIHDLIFLPGFSTADIVSDVSGRGVGMDVVRSNIAELGGGVELTSEEGRGTCFTVRLPLTLAILEGLSVQAGDHVYILPLVSIIESIRLTDDQISRPAGGNEIFALRQEYLPLVRLHDLFHIKSHPTSLSQGIIVVIEADGKKAGLYVDDLLGQQQVVIKSLETHYHRVEGISAATILGDGTVAMILDASGLVRMAHVPSVVAAGASALPNSISLMPAGVPANTTGHELRN